MGSGNTFLVLCFLIILLMTSVFAQPRIAGGQRAVVGQFKFVVALEMKIFVTPRNIIVSGCTGSILSESWIITAAHCLGTHIVANEIMGMKNVTRTQVLAGDVNSGRAFTSQETSGQLRYSSKYYTHPEAYDLDTAKFFARLQHNKEFLSLYQKLSNFFGSGFDIALLQLDKPFKFGTIIGAITLATDFDSVNNQLNCTVVGFGMTSSSYQSRQHLNYIPVTIGGKEYCKSEEPNESFNGDYTVCVRGKKEFMNPCVGDSGGPVVCGEDDQKQVLYGVGSTGAHQNISDFCGKSKIITSFYIFPNYAAVWIANITGLHTDLTDPTDAVDDAPASCGPFLAFEATLFALVVFKSSWDIINY